MTKKRLQQPQRQAGRIFAGLVSGVGGKRRDNYQQGMCTGYKYDAKRTKVMIDGSDP